MSKRRFFMDKKYVFISYASENYSEATKVCIYLESKGIQCWISPRNVEPGESYGLQITNAINDCSAHIVLVSKTPVEGTNVLNEISTSTSKNKQIFVLKLEDFSLPEGYLFLFGKERWINAYSNFDKGLLELEEAINTMLNEGIDTNNASVSPEIEEPKFEESKFDNFNDNQSQNNKEQENQTKYKYCTNCGSKMDIALPICTNCGQKFQNTIPHKYCTNCGSKMDSLLPFCTNCGTAFDDNKNGPNYDTVNLNSLEIATLVFMIIGTILNAIYFVGISLIWCIPMTIHFYKKARKLEPVGTGFKICTILFIGLIPGILMFCNKDV